MASSPHPWSLKGITPAAREAAKQAAEEDGVTLGIWLTRLISYAAADQGVTAADIVDRSAPRIVIAEPAPQIPARPSSIERLMRRSGDTQVETQD